MHKTMDRRRFLGAVAGSVASAGAIGWIAHYFSGSRTRRRWDSESAEAIAAMGDVAEVYRRAFALGKPMLVLVIPERDGMKNDRGGLFGSLLNHGGPSAYLDLALCELVCATVADVRAQIRGVEVRDEPLMLLVETDRPGGRVMPVDPELRKDRPTASWTERNDDEIDAFVRDRMDALASALHDALLPNATSLAARASLVEQRLAEREVRSLRALVEADAAGDPADLDRGAALVRSIAEDPAAHRARVLRALAQAAEARVKGRPVGAKWAHGGCGIEIEGEPPSGINCGMGYTPELSRRFLWFFTK